MGGRYTLPRRLCTCKCDVCELKLRIVSKHTIRQSLLKALVEHKRYCRESEHTPLQHGSVIPNVAPPVLMYTQSC